MYTDCYNCPFAKWRYCWFICPISGKEYEDGSKRIPKKCPYENMTLKEIKTQKRGEQKNVHRA